MDQTRDLVWENCWLHSSRPSDNGRYRLGCFIYPYVFQTQRKTTLCCSPGAYLPRGIRWSRLDGRATKGRMEPSEPGNKGTVVTCRTQHCWQREVLRTTRDLHRVPRQIHETKTVPFSVRPADAPVVGTLGRHRHDLDCHSNPTGQKRDATEAKRQRETVLAIARSGGIVLYDFQDASRYVDKSPVDTRTLPLVWLHSILGADMFADVVEVCPGTSPTRVMTDATLTHFRELPRLRRVELSSTQVTDAGLRHLEGLTQLQSLGLAVTNITDGGLRHLSRLSQLQTLDLTQTKVTNAGLSSLNGLTHLRELYLGRTQVTDAGLDQLKEMPELQVLTMDATRITDAGLEHLRGLTQLQDLFLADTQVSDSGVKRLQQALPTCRIHRVPLGHDAIREG